ncbi:thioredoxin-disulfide reductase [Eubacteriales bacterium OttesenSCG-928-M02]|nr:thioredoxin-disulfide reductase [Eubacteriales bacterium OttesenSCG-928-M02]
MEKNMVDLLIIGGGPAGYTAAIYGARAGLAPLVLEQAAAGGQMATTNEVENYPGFPDGIGGPELALLMQRQAERLGAETKTEAVTGVALDGAEKRIITDKGEYISKAVIIATGASPRAMEVPGEAELRGMGVSYCATCDGFFFRNMDVCVVGGGDTAVEDALYLSNVAKSVTLIHRRDEFRAARSLVQKLEGKENIRLVLDTIPVKVNGKFEVESLTVQNKNTGEERDIPCAGIFVAVGQIPHSALFVGQLEMENGYILTDERTLLTNIPGVFAAGDVRKKELRQILTAAADGAMAAVAAERYLSAL